MDLTMIVDVLRGSKNKKVLELGFDKLKHLWNNERLQLMKGLKTFINTLVSHGFLDSKRKSRY